MSKLMEIEDVVQHLKGRILHSEKRYEQVLEDHGDMPHLTHNYFGGVAAGYWLGMSTGYDNALEWVLDYIVENNKGVLPDNILEIIKEKRLKENE